MTKIRAYLRILVCGLALQAGQLPAAADWLYTPGGGPSKFMSFNASSSPVAGTGACAATNVDCMVFSPVNTAGAPLFTSTTPGRVDPTGSTTQPVSAASLPLPTGAATSALQGTGNTSLASILTALGSPMQASGGSVTANAGTNLNTSLLAVESGGNIAAINTGQGAPGATACTTDTASCNQNQQLQRLAQRLSTINTTLGTPFQAAGSIGNTGFNALQGGAANAVGNPFFMSPATGATFPISAASLPLPTGAATQTTLASLLTALGTPFQAGGNIGNTTFAVTQATAANLNMTCANCSGSGASAVDEATYVPGSPTVFAPGGMFFQTTATNNALSNLQNGMWQGTAQRAGFVNLRNASGAEIGVAAAPVQVSLANTGANGTAVAVSQATSSNLKGQFDPLTIATWGLAPVAAGTAPTNAQVIGCIQASPTPSANQSVAVSCDAAGNVKVVGTGILDTSSFSQPTTQGSGVLGLVNTSARSGLTNATMSYLSLDATAALRVAIVSGAGSGGTASNFGSAFPTAGTAMGASDGTNMVGVRASNYGTSPGAVTALATNSFVTNTVASNTSQVNGVTTLTGTGAVGTGAQRIAVGTDTATIAGSAPGTAGTPSTNVVSVQGVGSGTNLPVSQATAANLNATVVGNGTFAVQNTTAVNSTLTDCSVTLTTGGTAQNAFTGQTGVHGFTVANIDTTAGSGEPVWISWSTTAAAAAVQSYPLQAPTATTFASAGSFTSPPGMGVTALSVIAATTGHKISCTRW